MTTEVRAWGTQLAHVAAGRWSPPPAFGFGAFSLGKQPRMWDATQRHPLRALVVFAVWGFVIVDGTRRTLADDATTRRTWPLIAFLVLAGAAVPLSALIHTRPEFDAHRTQMSMAVAFSPIILAVGAAVAGADLWILWVSLILGVSLAGWWAWDNRRRTLSV
jgi:hypothetical protein